MTREQYLKLEENLKQAGYRRYNRSVTNETYYFCKGFEYVKDKDGDSSPSYQIIFSVWDHSMFTQFPDYDSFGVAIRVIMGGNGRIDLELTGVTYDIDEIESKAQSFYEWAKYNWNV